MRQRQGGEEAEAKKAAGQGVQPYQAEACLTGGPQVG